MRSFFLSAILVLLCCCSTVHAAAVPSAYTFSPEDFRTEAGLPTGILITECPGEGLLSCGSRQIFAGDALTAEQLCDLTLDSHSQLTTTASIRYIPVFAQAIGAEETLYLSLRGTKNQPPSAVDSSMETYKNLEITGTLHCEDPEEDPLIYILCKQPRRGEVAFHRDGTFTYVPNREKVGKDTFSYFVEDTAGNRSREATVTISILNPVSSAVFADMRGDPDAFYALFLKETGLFSGEEIGNILCFRPDQIVGQEEFLMMLLSLTGLSPEAETASFSSDWFQPWRAAALRAGLPTESDDCFTAGDASGIAGQLLHIDADCAAGEHAMLTRRTAAKLLYQISCKLAEQDFVYPWQ